MPSGKATASSATATVCSSPENLPKNLILVEGHGLYLMEGTGFSPYIIKAKMNEDFSP
jgi:hypothetical protein